MKKAGIIVLIVLNLVVLLGQIWPDGAPPFARTVNIVFLILNLLFFALLIYKRNSN
ncbi:MAG: hypothetical protein HN704_08265 [Bacteroidetes bacterium]|nr:hypothetical protein [Bacteroidota bacterium]MBT6686899.1 hypothetical protein [Bacteroidota bacterium]MBT7144203.1 hypothetical protein [Bacteroidota bacterium]MBT7491586.1 hypothetical protein [Bacteroidota bacterium]